MGGNPWTLVVGLGSNGKEKSWCKVQGHAGQAGQSTHLGRTCFALQHFGSLLLRRPVLRPWCETRGRRAKRSSRCAQEERSGHLSIGNVSAEEEQKCAHQSA
eukprot:scaffold11422_cov71-Phaeocystis_antarctica.AAC.2